MGGRRAGVAGAASLGEGAPNPTHRPVRSGGVRALESFENVKLADLAGPAGITHPAASLKPQRRSPPPPARRRTLRPAAARLAPALLRRRIARHGLHLPAVTGADLRLVIAQVAGRHRRRCRRPRPASMNPSMARRFGQIGSLDLVDLRPRDRASSTGRPSLTDSTPSPAPASSTRPGRSPASVRRAPRTGGPSLNYLTRAPASRRHLGRRRAA